MSSPTPTDMPEEGKDEGVWKAVSGEDANVSGEDANVPGEDANVPGEDTNVPLRSHWSTAAEPLEYRCGMYIGTQKSRTDHMLYHLYCFIIYLSATTFCASFNAFLE